MRQVIVTLLPALVALLSVDATRGDEAATRIAQILQSWEAASAIIKNFDAKFTRYDYDDVFEIEKRATGRLYFEAPNKGRLEIRGAVVTGNSQSRKKNASGDSFRAISDFPQTWIWNKGRVLKLNDAEKMYETIDLQVELQVSESKGFLAGLGFVLYQPQNLMPLVVGVDGETLRQRFQFSLEAKSESEYRLSAIPASRHFRASFQKLQIILGRKSYATVAIQFTDASGNRQVVYVFSDVRINELLEPQDHPLDPNLEGYRNIAARIRR